MGKINRTYGPIHFEDLEPHRFEDLIRQLTYDLRDWQVIEATGRSGSDDGIDIRAFEKMFSGGADEPDTVEEAETPQPMMGRRWIIQCKREKEIGPKKVASIVSEIDSEDPPYGYVLAAACNFSKQSYDRLRQEVVRKGVSEFYLWGKAELEDMLYQPKNDHVLFAFFGVSLVTRRRSRTTEIRRRILNKNKLLRVLGDTLGFTQVLLREANDDQYPFDENYADFDEFPRWKVLRAVKYHPHGLILRTREYFGYVDQDRKEFDFADSVSLLMGDDDEPWELRKAKREKRELIEDFWNHLPNRNKCTYIADRLLSFDDILLIDEHGIAPHKLPHIFVESKGGPGRYFAGGWEFAELRSGTAGSEEISLEEEYRRIELFPKVFPAAVVGAIIPSSNIPIEVLTAQSVGLNPNIREFFLLNDQGEDLKPRDVIILGSDDNGMPSRTGSRDTPRYLQITYIETVRIGIFFDHVEKNYRLEMLGRIFGRAFGDDDRVKRVEFVETYARKIGLDGD